MICHAEGCIREEKASWNVRYGEMYGSRQDKNNFNRAYILNMTKYVCFASLYMI